MPRNRVIYQSEAVYAGATGANPQLLRRVQSCNYNFKIDRTDINQFGQLAAIDRQILQEPTVAVDLTYYYATDTSNRNEENLGLDLSGIHMLGSITSGVAAKEQRNIFIVTSSPGVDALGGIGVSTSSGIIGIGNCFLTSWSLEAAVGAIPTVSCAFEGQNINFGTSNPVTQPNVDPNGVASTATVNFLQAAAYATSEVAAVRPGNITFALGTANDGLPFGLSESDLKVQSITVGLTLAREPLRKLGKHFAFARELTYPIMCTMTVNAIVGDLVIANLATLVGAAGGAGDLATFTASITLTGWTTASSPASSSSTFTLRGCKLNSQNITSSIGANKSVTMEFGAQIGANSGLVMT